MKKGDVPRKLASVRVEEWLALFLFIVVSAINLFYYGDFSWQDTMVAMVKYFSFGNELYFLFSLCIYIVFFFWGFKRFSHDIIAAVIDRVPLHKGVFFELGKTLLEPIRILAPIALVSVAFFQLLANLDAVLGYRTDDLLLYHADKALLGVAPFFSLPTIFTSPFLTSFFWISYSSLAVVVSALLFYIFLRSPKWLFRLNILAFIFTLVFAFPIYYVIPCKDPNNAFMRAPLENVPAEVRSDLEKYKPTAKTQDLIKGIYEAESKEGTRPVPISCFPSMHAAWAFIPIFFLAKINRRSLLLSVPWIALVLTGGVYFAQHYVVDYLAAIPISALSIFCAHILLGWERKHSVQSAPGE